MSSLKVCDTLREKERNVDFTFFNKGKFVIFDKVRVNIEESSIFGNITNKTVYCVFIAVTST